MPKSVTSHKALSHTFYLHALINGTPYLYLHFMTSKALKSTNFMSFIVILYFFVILALEISMGQ
jgi:hypothetical protein